MKQECIKCGNMLEAKIGSKLKNCKGLGILIDVKCLKCGCINNLRSVMKGADNDEVEEFIKKNSEKDKRMFG